jgi:UDP-N-acetylglucosamine acyltransferase
MISPLALVEAGAELGEGVEIGPFCHIGAGARIGAGTKLASHVVVHGCVSIGADCRIDAFCALGGLPQDTSYKGEPTTLTIGARNTLREHVTMHRGTVRGRGETRVGDDGYFMAQTHVAHDCIVGDKVMLSQGAVIGGHVIVEDFAILGGLSAVHQRTRIGRYAFLGGLAALVQDLIPYGAAFGNHAHLQGLNLVGLKRRGFSRDQIHALRAAYRGLFEGEGVFQDRVQAVAERFADQPQVMEIVSFIRADAARPLCAPAYPGA